jgi:methionine-rich copper-binding protein CopC
MKFTTKQTSPRFLPSIIRDGRLRRPRTQRAQSETVKRLPIARLTVIALLFAATSAWAHAFLDHAEPAVGSKVDAPLSEIKIWFTEKLEPAFSQIQLFDHHGKPVTQAHATVDPSDPSLLRLAVPALAPGSYKVTWKVMSVDTHMTVGNFSFTVRKPR